MVTKQGAVSLLNDPVAVALLQSATPARLAYVGSDGMPRAIPIWFHWDGASLVLASPSKSAKVSSISKHPQVALTIDGETWPYKVLQVRGTARVETVSGVVPEYALAAERYFGAEQGKAWVAQIGALFTHMSRITVTPTWVAVMDFEQRFPNVIEAAMAAG